MKAFSGKTVLITGATGGFGLAVAKKMADAGANLVLADLSGEKLDELSKSMKKNTEVGVLAGDVSEPEHHEALVELAIRTTGRLDVSINNAGIVNSMTGLSDIPIDEAKAVIDIDLMGVFYALRAQLPVMAQNFLDTGATASIVNVASVAGLVGSPFLTIYSAAKHGVVGLTKGAAAEYAKRGVRINAVCPSFAATEMLEKYYRESKKEREAATGALVRSVPMGRIAQTDEVVQAILFAANPENSFMTGETLAVDGGLSAV